MKSAPFVPATLLAASVITVLAAAPIFPMGTRTVLVRAAADAALPADVSFVSTPAPGYTVLHGDAAQIRSVFGFTVGWEGGPPCSTRL